MPVELQYVLFTATSRAPVPLMAIKQKCGETDFIILKQMVHNGRQGGSEGVMGVEGGGRGRRRLLERGRLQLDDLHVANLTPAPTLIQH